MGTELTVVIPTYNEAQNVLPLYQALERALGDVAWEAVFVDDDSPDQTFKIARDLARKDSRVRVIQRIGRRGLSSACIEGMLASSSPYIAVIDADLQHDESLLPGMLATLKEQQLDIVAASRYLADASTGNLSQNRVNISKFAIVLARRLLGTTLTDPMSGFFVITRDYLDQVSHQLYGQGFKILLDLCSSADQEPKLTELPYTMRARQAGESKLDSQVVLEFLLLLLYRFVGRILPVRFLLFALVGLSGVVVNLSVLGLGHKLLGYEYLPSQVTAVLVAMTTNFLLNNRYTFPHQQLHGLKVISGLLSFYLTCSIGAIIAVAIGEFLFGLGWIWWAAGLTATFISAFWNFSLSSIFTWGKLSKTRQ